jgi:5-methyltetrahydrofolate--homocysteine methyltransferase
MIGIMSSDPLIEMLADLREEEAIATVTSRLAAGEDHLQILESCRSAMGIVGHRFENKEYFLPDLIMAGEILRQISELIKPLLDSSEGRQHLGTVVLGTVHGDIHYIGKNLVKFMLEANGFEVHDLGEDVPPPRFVEAIHTVQPQIVGMSGLLTIVFDAIKDTIDAIAAAGLRDQVKIMIGGSQIDERVRAYTGADAYGSDAMAAVKLAKQWVGGE